MMLHACNFEALLQQHTPKALASPHGHGPGQNCCSAKPYSVYICDAEQLASNIVTVGMHAYALPHGGSLAYL